MVALSWIKAVREFIGVRYDKNHRHDRPAQHLGGEIVLLHHCKALAEQQPLLEVDDLRRSVGRNERVEQRCRAARIVDALCRDLGR